MRPTRARVVRMDGPRPGKKVTPKDPDLVALGEWWLRQYGGYPGTKAGRRKFRAALEELRETGKMPRTARQRAASERRRGSAYGVERKRWDIAQVARHRRITAQRR